MHRINVNSLGYDLTREVPSSEEEYNGLAPARTNPCLEDASANILYRGTFPVSRNAFVEKVIELSGIERVNHGTEDEPQMETEARYHKRALETVMKRDGKTEQQVRAEWQPYHQVCMDAAPFPVAEKEYAGTGPAVGKRDLTLAEACIKEGKANAVAAKLATILGRVVDGTDAKNLARAIADNRRALAAKAELEQKEALGL